MVAAPHGHGAHGGGSGMKHRVAEALENPWLEAMVVFLVLVDVFLVTMEAGIDHHIICIGGKQVPFGSRAGVHHLDHADHHHTVHHSEGPSGSIGTHDEAGGPSGGPGGDGLEHHPSFLAVGGMGGRSWRRELPGGLRHVQRALDHELMTDAARVDGQAARALAESDHQHAEAAHLLAVVHGDTRAMKAAAKEVSQLEEEIEDSNKAYRDVRWAHQQAKERSQQLINDLGQPPVLVCNSRKGHEAHHIMHTCHFWSIVILCVFVVELLLKSWAIPAFCASRYHQLDSFVVVVSLIIDTIVMWYIEGMEPGDETRAQTGKETLELVAGLLILSRTWRVVRICHGLFEQYKHISEEVRKPEEENEKLRKILHGLGKDPDRELEHMEHHAA